MRVNNRFCLLFGGVIKKSSLLLLLRPFFKSVYATEQPLAKQIQSSQSIIIKLFLFLCLLPDISLSQEISIDSIQNILNEHVSQDTIRVELLNAKAEAYFSINIDTTYVYALAAEKLSKKLNFKAGKARSQVLICRYLTRLFKQEEALKYGDEALKFYEQISDTTEILECYRFLGKIIYKNHDLKKAMAYFQKMEILSKQSNKKKQLSEALELMSKIYWDWDRVDQAKEVANEALRIANEINYLKGISKALISIGNFKRYQSKYSEAIRYYKEALIAAKKIEDKEIPPVLMHNIGVVHISQNNNKKGLEYLNEAITAYRKTKDKHNLARCLGDIGSIYVNQKKYKLALSMYLESLEIAEQLNIITGKVRTYANIGAVYTKLKKYSLSEKYFKTSLEEAIKNKMTHTFYMYLGLGKVYFNKGQYDKALWNASKSLQVIEQLEIIEHKNEIHELLASINYKIGNYKEAYKNQVLFKNISDTLFNKETTIKIAQLESEFKYREDLLSAELREKKLITENQKTSEKLIIVKRQHLYTIIGLLSLALLSISLFFFFRIRNWKLKTKNILIEQKLLRSQMTPHFIFNVLAVLQSIILNKENKKAIIYLSKFSRLLRLSLENSRDKLVIMQNEIKALENYLEIQNISRKHPFTYTISIKEDTIKSNKILIPPMIIQPFVENAIEHGFKNDSEAQEITINFINDMNNALICEILDNGVGIDAYKEHVSITKRSLSTTIISEHLTILGKEFNVASGITINDRKSNNEQGTIVKITLPYKTA